MSNNVSAAFQAYWSRRMQRKMYKTDVFRAIANFEEETKLKEGDTVHRPYRSALQAQDYTRGTSFQVQDIVTTDESLVVNQAKVVPFYVDDLDELQNSYKLKNQFADDAAVLLGNIIDGQVLAEVVNASSVVDEADFGGTLGNGITLSTGNVQRIFSSGDKKLNRLNVPTDGRVSVISPDFKQAILDYLAGKESQLGDATGLNGNVGKYYNFNLNVSNNLLWTGELFLATVPTANDTITINGVTFTFVAAVGATPGNVLIGGSADIARANLVDAINKAASAGTNFVELTPANRAKLYAYSAVNNNATDVLTLSAKGASYVIVSETLTNALDVWTPAKQIQHNLFCKSGAVDVVIQKYPNLEIKDVPDKIGKNLVPWSLFGLKTFAEGQPYMVDVKIRTDLF